MEDHHSGLPLGEMIRRQRELAELPLRRLASMVGISGPYLSQIERGLRVPSDRVLQAIADALRTTADVLVAPSVVPAAPPPVLAAIAVDPDLTARQRRALAEVYAAMTEVTVARGGVTRERPGA
ncbi:helix-turn-helix transcriptional regulator [Actinoplanes sp. NBRC 101535]|uniref:helix-turn-helix domain-containing protein n=1 Tax=Actinoplanes sp. NBRC 101535 TaxID=3032196 RepID=UPI0025572A57|nr:helix-turn-helix transcriptional regulator [Actinoplanes sp. NBRC 101535]